jgi:hypothetical protein
MLQEIQYYNKKGNYTTLFALIFEILSTFNIMISIFMHDNCLKKYTQNNLC